MLKPLIRKVERCMPLNRGTFLEAHIADLHFGALDPKYQYDILKEQFLNRIYKLKLDVLCIAGDSLDHKFMSSSDAVLYLSKFIQDCVNYCRINDTTLIIIRGTYEHDENQLKLFHHYIQDQTVDVRIIENVRFEYVKGKRILCIPEIYGQTEDFYNKFLIYSGYYDMVCMHGTFINTIHGKNEENLGSSREPVFSIRNFNKCLGPIISGHNHVPGCHAGHFYYCGSPYRWKFGEEHDKGFLILLHNLDTREYTIHFEPIMSYRYDTFNLDEMLKSDPKHIINRIKELESSGIDNIRIEFTVDNEEILNIVKNYYRNNSKIKIFENFDKVKKVLKESEELSNKYKDYGFIFDRNLEPEDIMSRYINYDLGYKFITTEELKSILSGDD